MANLAELLDYNEHACVSNKDIMDWFKAQAHLKPTKFSDVEEAYNQRFPHHKKRGKGDFKYWLDKYRTW
jgi:hypothetical protein